MKYRYLGNSGLLVSRLCLGTMTFGMKDWGCDRETAVAITHKFLDAGGNFIDTADMYSQGVSEEMLGEAIGGLDRDDLVLATKCWFRMRPSPNAKGLSRKHILEAVEASLRRLGTDYLDLYQVHGPDPFTPMEETMRTLDDLVRGGKVRYIGCSNYYGWQIAKAQGIADRRQLTRFVSGQHMYNLLRRDIEREVLPACADAGMGMLCWSPLGGGMLTGKYRRQPDPPHPKRADDEVFELLEANAPALALHAVAVAVARRGAAARLLEVFAQEPERDAGHLAALAALAAHRDQPPPTAGKRSTRSPAARGDSRARSR